MFTLTHAAPTRRLLMGLILLAGLLVLQPARAYLLWKTDLNGATVYLLGTLHFGTPDMYPLAAPVQRALEEADVLVVELDILNTPPMAMASTILTLGLYQDGSTLKDHLSPRTWRELQAVLQEQNIPPLLIQMQKPWLAALTLSALQVKSAGLSEHLGVEQQLLQQAGDRRIVELETLEEQLGLFTTLSEREQEAFLSLTLGELEQGPSQMRAIVEAWRRGDVGTTDQLVNRDMAQSGSLGRRLHRMLLTDRNETMVARLRDLVEPDKTYLVAVGAGHMVGDEGIVARLRRLGRGVERL